MIVFLVGLIVLKVFFEYLYIDGLSALWVFSDIVEYAERKALIAFAFLNFEVSFILDRFLEVVEMYEYVWVIVVFDWD